ncbi:hypothetical protein HK101_009199 [Irineochytrium annulatum]|nr:hypothetical protein HK101_009199 [Irineochytrium annulatum]
MLAEKALVEDAMASVGSDDEGAPVGDARLKRHVEREFKGWMGETGRSQQLYKLIMLSKWLKDDGVTDIGAGSEVREGKGVIKVVADAC